MSNQKLADALRAMIPYCMIDEQDPDAQQDRAVLAAAREALAEHDASEHQEGLMIISNPVDGFRFVGPFACESDGVEWAVQHAPHETWTTATMQEPQA